MFHGFFKYGETEVANNFRVSEYVKNGLKPTGAFIEDCGDCGDLPLVTAGLERYDTPALDDAPWVTTEDSDSVDFAGIFVREVTGLEGSTTTVDVSEKIGDGGAIGTRRANSRTVAVTADVVARTREATDIGIEWLSSILHPPCAAGSDCGGDILHLFSTCPSACRGRTDPDDAYETVLYEGMANFSGSDQFAASKTVTSLLKNGSFELGDGSSITNWAPQGDFFWHTAGVTAASVAATGGVSPVNRSRMGRVTFPALAATGNNGVFIGQDVTGLTIGRRYVISGWVYVPTATGFGVRLGANGVFGGFSDICSRKDGWFYVSHAITAEATSHKMGWWFSGGTGVPAGAVAYFDATMLIEDTGGLRTTSFSIPGNIEGWSGTDAVDTTFTAPFNMAISGNALVLTWRSALTAGTDRQAAYGLVHNTRPGELYTVSFEVYVAAGSPDVQGDILFHNQGTAKPVVRTKDAWVPVVMTYRAESTFTRFGVRTAEGQGSPGTNTRTVGIRNPRVWPGLAPLQQGYFDGASADIAAGNIAVNPTFDTGTSGWSPAGGVTVAQDLNQKHSGLASMRVETTAANSGVASTQVTARADSWYTARVWVRGTGTFRAWLASYPGDILMSFSPTVVLTDEWQQVAWSARTPLGAATTYLYAQQLSGGNQEFWIDDVDVRAVAPYDFSWAGAADASNAIATPLSMSFDWTPSEGLLGPQNLIGPLREGVCDTIEVTWVVSSTSGALLSAGWGDSSGALLSADDAVLVGSAPMEVTSVREASEAFPDDWRPLLVNDPLPGTGTARPYGAPDPVVVHSLTVRHRPILTVEECVGPYRRTLHNVVTVDGPKVVEWLTLGDDTTDSTVARVEWTWVATDPHAWHEPLPIITDAAGKANTQAYSAPTVQISSTSTAAVNATACARPAATALTCADNTLGPGISLPPQAPVIADSGIMNLAGSNRTRRYFEIPEDLSPLGVGKFSWRFQNDSKPKFGIRVRIYEDIDPAFTPPSSECAFIEEFTVEYLAPNQILFIDGPGDDVYVWCADDPYGNPIYAPAIKNVRGNYGGPFKNSLVGCGRPYLITVDVPDTYTNAPSNLSGQTTGTSQGDVLWSVDLVRRA